MSKNILVLASTFPRWRGDSEPAFVEYLSLQLAKYHQVHVLVPHAKDAADHELWRGENYNGENPTPAIEVFRFRYFFEAGQTLAYDGGILTNLGRHPIRFLLVPFFILSQLWWIIRLHHRYQYDVIHAHWIIPQGFLAVLFNVLKPWGKHPKVIVTSHGGDLFALKGPILDRLKSWVLRRADAVTVVSEAMKEHCAQLGIDAKRILVRSMGVDLLNRFTPGDADWSQRHGIIFVGRLVEKKGLEYLIHAMPHLLKHQPECHLRIIGDGPLRDELETLAHSLRLHAKITFIGSIANSEIPPLLRSAKVAIIPSIIAKSGDQEGLGLVAVEAMGCGCAVVASDLPAIRDVIKHEQTGLLARPRDPVDLANKIAHLLNNPIELQHLAEKGRKFVRDHFDWQQVGREYAELIGRI